MNRVTTREGRDVPAGTSRPCSLSARAGFYARYADQDSAARTDWPDVNANMHGSSV